MKSDLDQHNELCRRMIPTQVKDHANCLINLFRWYAMHLLAESAVIKLVAANLTSGINPLPLYPAAAARREIGHRLRW